MDILNHKVTMWRVWAKSLGQKDGKSDKEADRIAIIRTLIMFQLIVTNGFIIAGNVKNLWYASPQTCTIPLTFPDK